MFLLLIPVLEVVLALNGAAAQAVTQLDSHINVSEGARLELRCNYSSSYAPYLFWYVQYPKGGLQLLLKYISGETVVKGIRGFEAEFKKEEYSFHLSKPAAHLNDQAMYFCALSDLNNNVHTFGGGTRLMVKAHITNPDPAVYQLESPTANTSLCLFTDFNEKNVTLKRNVTFKTNTTALDMQSMDSKSNAILTLVDNSQTTCDQTFSASFYSSSDFSCDANLVAKSFESDWNLNLQNLSVIGFRILFLKVAGFNLLMTLRLWSS